MLVTGSADKTVRVWVVDRAALPDPTDAVGHNSQYSDVYREVVQILTRAALSLCLPRLIS